RPAKEDDYQALLAREGFVSPQHWTRHDLTLPKYGVIQQDLKDLDQHLLPAFWEFNQKAMHFQNRYFFYQWIFILGAFCTTVLGVLTTYAFTLPNENLEVAGYIIS